jgi:IS4 transposase
VVFGVYRGEDGCLKGGGSMFSAAFDRFIEHSAVSVMFRGLLEDALSSEAVDRVFHQRARAQYCGELAFSTVVDVLALVVLRIHKSVHAVYAAKAVDVSTSVNALYDKLNGVEPAVCEGLVRAIAQRQAAVLRQCAEPTELLAGYTVRIADGNHLAGTQHRLKELRSLGAAALPGQALVVFDPQWQLAVDMIACPDGHASECTLLEALLAKVAAGELWIADRGLCTPSFLAGVAGRSACFCIRQHQGFLNGELAGERRAAGRIDTGQVFEQTLRFRTPQGQEHTVRRVTIRLGKATRGGEREIHILSNLPARIPAATIAELYADRWQIETAFQEVAVHLRSEINTLGYPSAALLGFSIGLILYNLLSVIRRALSEVHAAACQDRKVSIYALADEVSGVYRGMAIAVADSHWQRAFAGRTAQQLADSLRRLAQQVPIPRYLTHRYGSKRPPPKRHSGGRGNHVSTHRILQNRNSKK